ncbi:MAG: SET domain-containing protein [Bacteroidia bacterium]
MKTEKGTEQIIYSSFDRIDARESDYLYIAHSQVPNTGKGLYTVIPIWKGEIISFFKGELLSRREANKRAKKGHNKYFINMPDGSTMDSMHVKCFARYANDAEGFVKNKFKTNSVITLDDNDKVCLVAKKYIKAGEEIFCRYGKKYWMQFEKEINRV